MIYLASPYTKHGTQIREEYFEILCKVTADLFNQGLYVFAPIVYAHPIASKYKLPPDWEYWKEYDEKFISICSELWVLMLPGWEDSTGVEAEIQIAKKRGLIVKYMEIQADGTLKMKSEWQEKKL